MKHFKEVIVRYSSSIILAVILLIAVFFRFYNFPHNPPSLNWDEVSFAYNAHSLIETGKDEFGKSWPLYFESLNDFKLPVYMYLTVLSELIFGYNDFAVRFPTAFFGVLTVLVMYLFIHEVTKSKKIALLAAFFLAILPWHVQFSRYALEATIALFLTLLGLYTFLRAVQKNQWFFVLSFLLFGLTLYTYLSFRVIVPFILVLLIFLYRKSMSFTKKPFLVAGAVFLFFAAFVIRDSISQGGHVRLHGISIFNDAKAFQYEVYEMQYEGKLGINLPRRFFHEMPILINAGLVIHGYLTHFSPDFLFFDLGQEHHQAPKMGLLYLWMLPLIPLGFYVLLKEYQTKIKILFLSILILAPVPPSITFDVPHAIRSVALIIPLTFLSALGFYELMNFVDKKNILIRSTFFVMSALIIGLFSWYFFRQYQIHFPHEHSQKWEYGRHEMADYLAKVHTQYDKVIVSGNLEWPYIFMLYYSHYSPSSYLSQGGTNSGSWDAENNQYDNYQFHTFRVEEIKSGKLFVGTPKDFPSNIKTLYTISSLDETKAILIVDGATLAQKLNNCTLNQDETTQMYSPKELYEKTVIFCDSKNTSIIQ